MLGSISPATPAGQISFSSPAHQEPDWQDDIRRASGGRLTGPLTFYHDHDGNLAEDCGECRITVTCGWCNRSSQHGWRLDGSMRSEVRLSHCCGRMISIRPTAAPAAHEFNPRIRVARPTRLRRDVKPLSTPRPDGVSLLEWIRRRSQQEGPAA